MPPADPEQYRATSRASWADAAGAWGTYRHVIQAAGEPVSHWMVDAIDPQPGHRVLELAAGPGDTGLLAAELIEPGGTLISSDAVEEMVDVARARAAELGITNVEFRTIDAEWIDLPTADVDGVLARWGYMLLAAWADPEENPWSFAPRAELVAMGAMQPPAPDAPDMFALSDPQRIVGLLEETGFGDIVVEQLPIVYRYASLDDWWDTSLEISASLARGVVALTPAQRDDLRDAVDARLARYVADDGAVALPGLTHVAAAGA